MGHVYIDLQIENPINREWETLEAVMVDTGCTHTMLPGDFLRGIGIESLMTMPIQYINDEDELPVGQANLRFAGQSLALSCMVLFGPQDRFLIGSTTLENFNLMVDPVGGTLVRRTIWARPF